MTATYWAAVSRELWEDRDDFRHVEGFRFTGHTMRDRSETILAQAVDYGAAAALDGQCVEVVFVESGGTCRVLSRTVICEGDLR